MILLAIYLMCARASMRATAQYVPPAPCIGPVWRRR